MKTAHPISLVLLMVLFSSPIVQPDTSHATGRRPNIVVILSDDQGWGDLSLNGNPNLSTPHIDSLARDGVKFDRFYVCPVCSPTRAEFLTGRYHPRSGVYSTSAGGERLNADETTIAQVFKKAGYATGAFGKWHNGMQAPYHPNARGFDEFYGFCSGHWGNYFSPPLEHNGVAVQGKGFIIDDLTDQALKFIETKQNAPFFCYLPLNTPHSPMQVPDAYWERFKDKELVFRHRDFDQENVPHTRAALAMCENIDWNVGRILDQLDRLNLAENTIVLYFSDNGPNGSRWNGDMKGRKGSTDEGGVRSPLVMRWPKGIQPGSIVENIGAAIDLLPTLADMTGIEVNAVKSLDGISLKPLLMGGDYKGKDRLIFSHWNGRVSVRHQRFRLDHQGALFDIAADQGQRTNVAELYPDMTHQLRSEVEQWKADLLKGSPDKHRPFTVGHPEFERTWLPARDATSTGSIERSNRFPNDSYFTAWTSTEDYLQWNIEVLKSGDYQAIIWQTCAEKDSSPLLELNFNNHHLRARISETWDPPVMGAENDRIKRQESYVKDFRPFTLGQIHLPKAKGTLQLKALDIPGEKAPEIRLLELIRTKSKTSNGD
jgi:arylsulfatase A-like enzyme